MQIRIYDKDNNNEEIYFGDADEFLFENDNDEELELFLDSLERKPYGLRVPYYGNQGMVYLFEKEYTLLDD